MGIYLYARKALKKNNYAHDDIVGDLCFVFSMIGIEDISLINVNACANCLAW